jgi:hypothetical protein
MKYALTIVATLATLFALYAAFVLNLGTDADWVSGGYFGFALTVLTGMLPTACILVIRMR